MSAVESLRRANPVKRLGEGSWVSDGYSLPNRTINAPFMVWCPTGDDGDGNPLGHVLRYLDRSYTLRVR